MIQVLRHFVSITAASQLAWPVSVSVGVHTGLLVALGMMVSKSDHLPSEVPPLAVQMFASGEVLQDPDSSPVPVYGPTAQSDQPQAVPSASQVTLAGPSLRLLHRSIGTAANQMLLGSGPASPFDLMGSLGAPNEEGKAGGGATSSAAPAGTSSGSSFFGLQSYGNKIVFVVDISGSMHGHRMRRMRNELRHSLETLKVSQQFFIIFFSSVAMPMPADDLLAATPQNVAQTTHWLRQVECGGGTNPLPGLLMALHLRPDSIYLLTDGKFDPQVVWEVTQAQPAQRIPIYTICFASKKAERLLQAIADETGGMYRFVK